MAKVAFGGGVANLQGSVGGNTFTRSKSSSNIRNRVKPTNPATAAQVEARALMSQLSKRWRTLTDDQRRAWTVDAQQQPRVDKCGNVMKLAGNQHYVSVNVIRDIGLDEPIDDPPDVELVGFSPTFFGAQEDFTVIVEPRSFNIPFGAGAVENDIAVIYASAPLSPGVKPPIKSLKFLVSFVVSSAMISAGTIDWIDEYLHISGDIDGTADKAVTVSLRQYKSSALSFPELMKTVITAT